MPLLRQIAQKIVEANGTVTRLRGARSGVYGGPLRLLAVEVHDRLSADGVACGLLTGQERRLVEGASHLACTVEMCSTETPVEVAVLDEIQMLGHPERGWAWTRALLGLLDATDGGEAVHRARGAWHEAAATVAFVNSKPELGAYRRAADHELLEATLALKAAVLQGTP